MNATSVDVKDMLEEDSSLGLVCGVGGNLFVGKEPKSPNNITIDASSKLLFPTST
jgi:hypothetical protein